MPEGIWTVESRASMPSNVDDLTGMPMTGRVVFAAIAPARCAALPAAARIAPKPFVRADIAKARASSGVLWAENTWTSVGTLNSFSVVIAFSTMGRSLSLPIMTAILFKLTSLPKNAQRGRRNAKIRLPSRENQYGTLYCDISCVVNGFGIMETEKKRPKRGGGSSIRRAMLRTKPSPEGEGFGEGGSCGSSQLRQRVVDVHAVSLQREGQKIPACQVVAAEP